MWRQHKTSADAGRCLHEKVAGSMVDILAKRAAGGCRRAGRVEGYPICRLADQHSVRSAA